MAAKKNSNVKKIYTVTGRIHVDVGVDIDALDLNDALAKANELKLEDFVQLLGDHQDSSNPEIRSVWINDDSYL